jgi:hypothetical protein
VHLNSPHLTDQTRLSSGNVTTIGNNVFNQNTTHNTNVQITQNTFNINTNPTVTTVPQQHPIVSNEPPRVLNQTIGSQTNVNVFLNQTVIQQPAASATTSNSGSNNQQQMVAIAINGNQTLIPLSTFTKLLQSKSSNAQATGVSGRSARFFHSHSHFMPLSVIANDHNDSSAIADSHICDVVESMSTKWFVSSSSLPQHAFSLGGGSILLQNISGNSNSTTASTFRFVRPPNNSSPKGSHGITMAK